MQNSISLFLYLALFYVFFFLVPSFCILHAFMFLCLDSKRCVWLHQNICPRSIQARISHRVCPVRDAKTYGSLMNSIAINSIKSFVVSIHSTLLFCLFLSFGTYSSKNSQSLVNSCKEKKYLSQIFHFVNALNFNVSNFKVVEFGGSKTQNF